MVRYIATFEAAAAALLLGGCVGEPEDRAADEPAVETREAALLGNVSAAAPSGGFDVQCSPFLSAVFERTGDLVGNMLNSTAFRQCVETRMRAQYMDCGDGYTATSTDDAIRGVFAALENGNHYRWVCHTNPGDPGLSARLGAYRGHASKLLAINAGARWRDDYASWFAPPSRVWPWNFTVEGTIHEFLHQHGYNHMDSDESRERCALEHGRPADGYYDHNEPSAPYIVGLCALDVLALSGEIGPVEGPDAACATDEIRLVSSWPRGLGPASVGSYTFCETNADCSGGAECRRPAGGTGVCGTCTTSDHCRGLGPTYSCQAEACRDSRILITTTCVPNLRREVTLQSFVTNQPVRIGVGKEDGPVYLAAMADGHSRSRTSFWLMDVNRGQLVDGDPIQLKPPVDSWVGPLADGWVRQNRPSPVGLVIRGGAGPLGAGSWIWFESGASVIEAATGLTPFLRVTADSRTTRRFFRMDEPSRRLVYLASTGWNRWTEAPGGGELRTQRATTETPPRESAFWMIDHNGRKLRNWESVSFQRLDSEQYWSTAVNGEGAVRDDAVRYSAAETFQVVCVTCADPDDIKHGDIVAYRANGTGKYLTHMPHDWYPYQIRAWGEWVGSWQHTRIVEVGQYRNPATPLSELTRPSWTMR